MASRASAFLVAFFVLAVIGRGSSSVLATRASQAPAASGNTVWDGVYSAEQAERGKTAYERSCSRCHNRGAAPVLVGEAFTRSWFGETLGAPFTKIRNTMPENAPGSLPDAVLADILSFLLSESGFPAGGQELRPDAELLGTIRVVAKDGSAEVPNFSLVEVLGCLTQRSDQAWVLTSGTDPVRTRQPGQSTAAELKASEAKALGRHSFRLLDFASVGQEGAKGQKVAVKGFLIRQPNDDRLNVTSVHSFGGSCAP